MYNCAAAISYGMKFPKEVMQIIEKLGEAGYEAYVVGGCVRDLLMDKPPQDWDITTSAKPEEIQKVFPDSFYENEFGTVGIKTDSEDETLEVIEATTYRIESKYTDKRHPDEVKFAKKLEDDLKRRDFTINALAMNAGGEVVDLFGGREDIRSKVIRAVGKPEERFGEDALRMLRAVRFAAALGFEIETGTLKAIKKNHGLLQAISKERVRDELIKIIESAGADKGVELLRETELLKYILPELLEGVDVGQNRHHIYNVWEHNLLALKYACEKKYSTEVRLAALLHDVGKPRTKGGEGPESTFYGHEVVGAKMTAQALDRLKFPKQQAEKIVKLVRWHLFYYNVGEVTEASVRRLVAHIGIENVQDLIKVREADRIGSGVPKAKPYKLRHFEFMVEKALREPLSVKMLEVSGEDIMKTLKIEPGPRVGLILNALMNEVLDEPKRNGKEYLLGRIKELGEMTEEELKPLAAEGKIRIGEGEERWEEETKKKHYVS